MPSASASAAAATTNAVVSYRRHASKSRHPQERKFGAPKAAGGSRRNVRASAASCAEIEALRVKPGWHPDGSPEERVKQLGLQLDGRIATNPAGEDSARHHPHTKKNTC